MRAAVVAYEMEGPRTGVGRYLEGLLGGVAELAAGGHDWLLFFKGDPFDHPLWRETGDAGPLSPRFDRRPRARPILWEQLRLPRLLRRERLDLVFSPAYSLPPSPAVPGVVTVHDLSFEHLAEEFDLKERWRRRLLARRAARRAARVLVPAAEVAADLVRTYGVPPDKIAVVPEGVDPAFRPDAAARSADLGRIDRLGVKPPYLLHVGSMLRRRHLRLVIDTFAAVAGEHPQLTLVLAGRNRLPRPADLTAWIDRSGVAERILHPGYVPEEALSALYRCAACTFYLSSYEGFGLPPLEALACGTPAVVSRGLALDELWPAYPYRCRMLDRPTVVALTRRALAGSEESRAVAREGVERMSRLTWRRAAERFLVELERARAA